MQFYLARKSKPNWAVGLILGLDDEIIVGPDFLGLLDSNPRRVRPCRLG